MAAEHIDDNLGIDPRAPLIARQFAPVHELFQLLDGCEDKVDRLQTVELVLQLVEDVCKWVPHASTCHSTL